MVGLMRQSNFYRGRIAKQFDLLTELMRIDYNWNIEPKKIDNRKRENEGAKQ
jgi:hypothetical protein